MIDSPKSFWAAPNRAAESRGVTRDRVATRDGGVIRECLMCLGVSTDSRASGQQATAGA